LSNWVRTRRQTKLSTAAALRWLGKLVLCGWLLWAASITASQAQTGPACNPANPNQVRLQISINGMRSGNGSLVVTIYPNDAQHFLDGKYKVARQIVPVTLPVTHVCFVLSKPDYYAVAMFHDENNNGELDHNFLGIPTEGYGFSNNPKLRFGPPEFAQGRVRARPGDNPVAVQMQYY
jgi:uncharacterized protein (DUF2141 family)